MKSIAITFKQSTIIFCIWLTNWIRGSKYCSVKVSSIYLDHMMAQRKLRTHIWKKFCLLWSHLKNKIFKKSKNQTLFWWKICWSLCLLVLFHLIYKRLSYFSMTTKIYIKSKLKKANINKTEKFLWTYWQFQRSILIVFSHLWVKLNLNLKLSRLIQKKMRFRRRIIKTKENQL